MAVNNTRRLAGVAAIAIDGAVFDATEISWSPSTIKRESLISLNRVSGYSEMPVAGSISATFRDMGGFAIRALQDATQATVQVTLADGKQIVGTGMWLVDVMEAKAADGTYNVKFESDSVVEQTV